MTTSGTVGSTSLDFAKLTEKVYRRCGVPTGGITPELIDIARENLYLLFQTLSNRGINLWAVDHVLLGLREHKATYDMPTGTIDVLNASYRQPTLVTPTTTTVVSPTEIDYDFSAAQQVTMIKFSPTIAFTQLSILVGVSDDMINFDFFALGTSAADYVADEHYFFPMEPAWSKRYWVMAPVSVGHTVTGMAFEFAPSFTDLVISRLNRDDYEALPSKRSEGTTSLQYWFNRQIVPTMTLWPVPSVETNCLYLTTHRQIQDVGAMVNTIEVPDRWIDAVTWNLAAMCAVECPVVPADRIPLTQQMAQSSLILADGEERDTAPIYLAPNISVYTA